MDPSHTGIDLAVVDLAHLDENLEDELPNIAGGGKAGEVVAPAEGMDISSKVDGSPHQQRFDELEDSGDDAEPVMPKKRKLKMVIDLDDDDE